ASQLHIAQLRRVFRAANDYHMPIVVHLHPSITKERPWGRDQAQRFLNEVLSQTPDIPVQIAHLSSAGRYDDGSDQAMAVVADAITKRDPRSEERRVGKE